MQDIQVLGHFFILHTKLFQSADEENRKEYEIMNLAYS